MDRVNWVTGDAFNAVRQLSGASARGIDPSMVQHQLRTYIDSVLRRGPEAGLPQEDAREMAYAITALADEVAMGQPGPVREHWSRQPLQLALFHENLAGENFFRRLDAIRRDPHRLEVLRVYYLCLLFGFRGYYGFHGGEARLMALVESVRAQMEAALPVPEVLSPEGARPEARIRAVARRLPFVWVGLGIVVLSAVLYLGLQLSLRERTRVVVEYMAAQRAQASESDQ